MNEIRLYGSVGGRWWDEEYFSAATVREQLDGMTGPVTVRINSGGGIASEGQAIYTMLVDYPDEVHVVIDAVAASAASLIAMAGDTITMRLGSYMLIHDPAQPWTDGRGTSGEHEKLAQVLDIVAGAYAAVYAKRAGIGIEEARQIMRDETVMDGPIALQMGFCTDTDDTPAEPVARFNYGIYAHAPESWRAASTALGPVPGKTAVLAMMAGKPRIPEKEKTMAGKPSDTPAGTPADDQATPPATTEAEGEDATTQTTTVSAVVDQKTLSMIRATVSLGGFGPEMALDMISRGLTHEQALAEVLKARQQKEMDMTGNLHSGHAPARITADARDKFKAGARLALMEKAGIKGGERNEFSGLTLSELARESIIMAGGRAAFADRREMVGTAFTMAGAHTTSDFANVLANVMGKGALQGWEEAEETYQLWTRKGTLSDFKPTKRVGAGVFGALPQVIEGADYTYGTVGDRGEPITLATYGQLLRITRQAIINDDLSILGSMPRKMGRAARRTIGNLVYAILTSNPTMSDAVTLFHASHGNLAGTTGAPSVATLGAGRAAMRVQSDAGSALNIAPKYLIAPAALEMTAQQLLMSAVDPTATKGMAMNPVQNMATLITDARLDAASTTAWYLAADPNAYDTIEVAYLDGNDAPYLEEQTAWTADGVEMKVRIDAAAAPLDFRTLYKNAG